MKRRLADNFQHSPLTLSNNSTEINKIDHALSTAPQIQGKLMMENESLVHTDLNRITTTNIQNKNDPVAITEPSQEDTQTNTTYSKGSPINIATTSKTEVSNLRLNRVFIFGGKQCVGMAESLEKSRLWTRYKHYQIISFIKPYASTENILNCAKMFDFTSHDRIIVCVGQHDSNILHVMTESCIFLKSVKSPVFVLKVFKNIHLYEYKLNEMLTMISYQYQNCNYVNLDAYTNEIVICKKNNSMLDQLDYNLDFLNFKTKQTSTFGHNYDKQKYKLTSQGIHAGHPLKTYRNNIVRVDRGPQTENSDNFFS